MQSNMWWISPLVLVALRLLYLEARLTRVKFKENILIFRPVLGIRILMAVGIMGILGSGILSRGKEEFWIYALSVALLGLFCFALPPTITITSNSVCSETWWGKKTSIAWNDVVGLEKQSGSEAIVYGREGASVTFSPYHIDSSRFEHEILNRAKLINTIDSSVPPSFRIW